MSIWNFIFVVLLKIVVCSFDFLSLDVVLNFFDRKIEKPLHSIKLNS